MDEVDLMAPFADVGGGGELGFGAGVDWGAG